jgi:hypothetical protein
MVRFFRNKLNRGPKNWRLILLSARLKPLNAQWLFYIPLGFTHRGMDITKNSDYFSIQHELIICFLKLRRSVFTARYELNF